MYQSVQARLSQCNLICLSLSSQNKKYKETTSRESLNELHYIPLLKSPSSLMIRHELTYF